MTPKPRKKAGRSATEQALSSTHAPSPSQAPAPAPSQAPAPAPTQAPAHTPAPTPLVLIIALALTAVFALLASPPDTHRYPSLFETGRLLTLFGALLAAAAFTLHSRRPFALAPPLILSALTVLTLGLAALIARHGHDFRLFAVAHPATLGIPSEFFLVALTAGLALWSRSTPSGSLTLLGLGLGLSVACLFAPDTVLATTQTAFFDAFARGPLHAIVALTVLANLLTALAITLTRLGVPLPRAIATALPVATRALPLALAVVALGPAVTSANPLVGLVFLAGLVTLHLGVVAFATQTTLSPGFQRLTYIKAMTAIVGLWFLLKSHALIASNTDENIYFYMARLLGDGVWPYADYFFAHPPLHVVLPGVLFSVFGFSLTFAKLLPLAFCLIGGLALAATVRRFMGPVAAALALVLYLFGAEVLKASSNMTGVNMTTMFLLLGLWLSMKPRPFAAGLVLGLAPATGFYAMAPALAILAMNLFRRPATLAPAPPGYTPSAFARRLAPVRQFLAHLHRWRLAELSAFIVVLGGINLVFWGIGGDTFLEGVYAYHQQKSFQEPDMVEIFGGDPGFPLSVFHNVGVMVGSKSFVQEVFYHPHLWLAGLLLPLVVLAGWLSDPERRTRVLHVIRPSRLFTTGPDGQALFVWLVTVALFIQFAMFRELYSFYFALIYPFLAICAAFVIGRALTLLALPAPAPTPSPSPTSSLTPAHAPSSPRTPLWVPLTTTALALAALVTIQGHGALSLTHRAIFPDEAETTGARNAYDWTPSPLLTDLSPIIKTLFWEDFRIKGDVEPGARHYLWTKKRGFSRLDEVADFIQKNSQPDETIAGSSTLAPLIALMADRRIAADEVDTNNKRFRTGILSERDYWNAACADRLRFVVSAPRSYFTFEKMRSLPIIARFFGEPTLFEDPTLLYRSPFPIALFARRDAPCSWVQ